MIVRRAIFALLALAVAACSGGGRQSNPLPQENAERAPQLVKYGTGSLLLAVDREKLVPGSIARVLAFTAYSSTPVVCFYVKVPDPPANPYIGGITSDSAGHVYLSFQSGSIFGNEPYRFGAIAVFNTIPKTGTKSPDRLIVSSGLLITPSTFQGVSNGLAVDSQGRMYAGGLQSALGVFPADANGITTPAHENSCIEGPYSVALDTEGNYYISCSDNVSKFSPLPAAKLLGDIGALLCAACYSTPLVSIPSSNEIFVASVQFRGDRVGAPSFVETFPPGSGNGFGGANPTRLIMGAHTKLGFLHAIAACADGRIYLSQTPDSQFPGAPGGILEFGPTSKGDVGPLRILAEGDPTLSAIGF